MVLTTMQLKRIVSPEETTHPQHRVLANHTEIRVMVRDSCYAMTVGSHYLVVLKWGFLSKLHLLYLLHFGHI